MIKNYIVHDLEGAKRLDVFLDENLPDFTRSHIKTFINNGKVTLNKKVVKAGEKIHNGDEIYADLTARDTTLIAENIPLDIVYEDDDVIVVNKKKGMVVHPGNGNPDGTLVNALLYRDSNLSSINGDFRPGIVHRIDKDTSGLIIVAKNDFSHLELSKQISTKTCHRIYEAIVLGNIKADSGTIETFIGRDPKVRVRMCVCKEDSGRKAVTNFEVLERFDGYTHVRFELKTGRTHQIRVHCKYIGNPILGDEIYGPKKMPMKFDGQLLVAKKIVFLQPHTKEEMTFEIPLTDEFQKVLIKLRRKIK